MGIVGTFLFGVMIGLLIGVFFMSYGTLIIAEKSGYRFAGGKFIPK